MQSCSHGFPRSLGTVNELFAPPGSAWRAVSPALARLRRAVLGGAAAILLVVLVLLALVLHFPGWLLAIALVVAVCGFLAGWLLVGRNARSWGYAERDEDLFIRHGALFRTLVVVPYGRMQYVDVQSGPLARLCDIASVHLHTASPGTSARIPGLPADEAARLRDRLTSLGEAQAAGL
jgi:membrane protein YdbS with pleckstrin-like domain